MAMPCSNALKQEKALILVNAYSKWDDYFFVAIFLLMRLNVSGCSPI